MATETKPRNPSYYYNKAIGAFFLQFMAIFSEMQVKTGKTAERDDALIDIGIHYGYPDKIVASIIAKNTQNVPIKLPTMTAIIRGINLAPELYKGVSTERRISYVPVGGVLPDDATILHQRMPVPYVLEIALSIIASNTDQHYQILEQIMMIFDPVLTIQKTDALFDWSRLTEVTMTNISIDNNYPTGSGPRFEQSTISFNMPIYIDVPAKIRKNIVEKIFVRVGAVNNAINNCTNDEIIQQLDDMGLPYNLCFNVDNISVS